MNSAVLSSPLSRLCKRLCGCLIGALGSRETLPWTDCSSLITFTMQARSWGWNLPSEPFPASKGHPARGHPSPFLPGSWSLSGLQRQSLWDWEQHEGVLGETWRGEKGNSKVQTEVWQQSSSPSWKNPAQIHLPRVCSFSPWSGLPQSEELAGRQKLQSARLRVFVFLSVPDTPWEK